MTVLSVLMQHCSHHRSQSQEINYGFIYIFDDIVNRLITCDFTEVTLVTKAEIAP